jgi:hypothetical protein
MKGWLHAQLAFLSLTLITQSAFGQWTYKAKAEAYPTVSNYSDYSTDHIDRPTYSFFINPHEFEVLVVELSKKVDVFSAVWRKDKNAEFYGGTTRDFVYWVLGKIRVAKDMREYERIVRDLKALPVIRVREFIFAKSDIDIIANSSYPDVRAADYGVRKIDWMSRESFKSGTNAYYDEINQGYIPIEKIRLSYNGLQRGGHVGNGVYEIYSRRLTIHMPDMEQFNQTSRAKQKLNHPILLVLRFIRLLAMDYYYLNGRKAPDAEALIQKVKKHDQETIRRIVQKASDGHELLPYLKNHMFATWINGTIEKIYLSHTNVTAAHLLMKHFGILDLIRAYSAIKSPNQFLFAYNWDQHKIQTNLLRFRVAEENFFVPIDKALPDHILYHGASNDSNFRGIIFEGVIPSESNRLGGKGVYGVAADNLSFTYNNYGGADRVVEFTLSPDTRIVDITRGEGRRVFKELVQLFPNRVDIDVMDIMSMMFGIDLLIYPYNTKAFVLKNSQVIVGTKGHRLNPKASTDMLQAINNMDSLTDLNLIMQSLHYETYRTDELEVFRKAFLSEPVRARLTFFLRQLLPEFKNVPEHFDLLADAQTKLVNSVFSSSFAQAIYDISGSDLYSTLRAIKMAQLFDRLDVTGFLKLKDNMSMTAEVVLNQMRSRGFSFEDILSAFRLLGIADNSISKLCAQIVLEIRTKSDLIAMVKGVLSRNHGTLSKESTQEIIDHFFTLEPQIPEVKELEEALVDTVYGRIILWERSLPLVHTANEFLVLTRTDKNISLIESNQLNAFALKYLDFFLSKRPTPDELKQFETQCLFYLYDSVSLIQETLKRDDIIKDPADYLAMIDNTNQKKGRPFQLAIDEVIQHTLKERINDDWTLDHFHSLIIKSIYTDQGLITVWNLALQTYMARAAGGNPANFPLKEFLPLLEHPSHLARHDYIAAVNQFVDSSKEVLARLDWTPETLEKFLVQSQMATGPAESLIQAIYQRSADKPVNLALITAGTRYAPTSVRLGFQGFVNRAFQNLFDDCTDPAIWLQIANQMQLDPSQILKISRRILENPQTKASEVIDLLRMFSLRNDDISIPELFKDQFARFHIEFLKAALRQKLPLRTRAIIVLMAKYSFPQGLVAWQDFVNETTLADPRLSPELMDLRRDKNLRVLIHEVGFDNIQMPWWVRMRRQMDRTAQRLESCAQFLGW